MAVYNVIDHQELTGTAASWVEDSISQSYDHLLILASVRSNRAAVYDSLKLGFNDADTAGDYAHISLRAGSATPSSGINTAQAPTFIGDMNGANNLADSFSNVKIWVPNYANTANFKQAISLLVHVDTSAVTNEWGVELDAILFKGDGGSSTAAITEVSLHTGTGSFVEYSTFTLYGITGA